MENLEDILSDLLRKERSEFLLSGGDQSQLVFSALVEIEAEESHLVDLCSVIGAGWSIKELIEEWGMNSSTPLYKRAIAVELSHRELSWWERVNSPLGLLAQIRKVREEHTELLSKYK